MNVTRRMFLQALAAAAPTVVFFDIGGAYATAQARADRAGLWVVTWGARVDENGFPVLLGQDGTARFMEDVNRTLMNQLFYKQGVAVDQHLPEVVWK